LLFKVIANFLSAGGKEIMIIKTKTIVTTVAEIK